MDDAFCASSTGFYYQLQGYFLYQRRQSPNFSSRIPLARRRTGRHR
jgi:hypothetical protein